MLLVSKIDYVTLLQINLIGLTKYYFKSYFLLKKQVKKVVF